MERFLASPEGSPHKLVLAQAWGGGWWGKVEVGVSRGRCRELTVWGGQPQTQVSGLCLGMAHGYCGLWRTTAFHSGKKHIWPAPHTLLRECPIPTKPGLSGTHCRAS